MKLELNATPESVMHAVESLWKFGLQKGVPEKTLFSLALALEECATNIVKYGFSSDPNQKFQAIIEHTGTSVTIELRDRAPEFDPTQARPNPRRTEDDHQIGGWGIQLVRRYMDEIRYARENDENVLRLTKWLLPKANP